MKTRRRTELSGQTRVIIPLLMVLIILPITPVYSVVTFSPPQRLTSTIDNDQQPELLQALDGTGWLFWHTSTFFAPGNQDIHYRTYDGSSWAPEQALVTHPKQDVAPSAAQLPNGTILLSFSSNRTGDFNIFLKRYNPGSGWTADAQVTTNTNNEVVSSLVGASDGTLWLFHDRQIGSDNNVYYKTYTAATGWSAESAVTTDPLPDRQPTAFQARDGKIWVAWARTMDMQLKKLNLYYKTFSGGTWSGEAQRTTGNVVDRHPELFQDSDGTIWLLWARELQITGTTFQDDIFYVSSADNGSSWSAEAKLTDDGNNDLDDIQPTMSQLRDHKLWVFWSSDRNDDNFWDIHYSSSDALPSHDVAVTAASASPLKLKPGGPVTVTVTVQNKGTFTETFQVIVTAANTTTITLPSQTVTLAAGASQTLTFTWNTQNVTPKKYKITATAAAVTGESTANLNDNTLVDGTVWLIPPGDVDLDGDVDILDASLIAFSFGTRPGDARWNPNADLDVDLDVDVIDAAIMAFWFGTQT